MEQVSKTTKMIYIAVMAVFMAICAWITIPGIVPFTLQTFALYFGLWVFGGKYATYSLILYIIMGSVGIPVFSGFKGGVGVIIGPTGGYILGFILLTGIIWIYEKITKRISDIVKSSLMIAGTLFCYLCGSIWYMNILDVPFGKEGFVSVMMICVVPYLIPDAVKFVLAKLVGKRVSKRIDFVR